MINPTLAQAHLNKGEVGMVQPTPMVGNLMDAGTASKVALNPQQQISAQQLMTNVGQNADTAVQLNYVGHGIGITLESGPGHH